MYVLVFIVFVVLGAVLGVVSFLRKPISEVSVMTEPKESLAVADLGPAQDNMIHDVLVANTHLIAGKLLGILAYILGNEDEHGLTSIVITKDYPKNTAMENLMSRFQPDSRAMIVNLEGHLELAKEVMKEPNGYLSVWHYLWIQVIRSFFHELHHAHTFSDAAGGIYSVDTNDPEFEAKAEEWCNEEIIELAKVINIEPPSLEEFPYYTSEMYEVLRSITDGDVAEDWAERQFCCLAEGLTFYKPGVDGKSKDIRCVTVRDYFKMLAADNDPRWEQPVPGMGDWPAGKPMTVVEEPLVLSVVEQTVQASAEAEPTPALDEIKPDLSVAAIAVAKAHVVVDDSEPEFGAEETDGLLFDPNEGVMITDEDGDVAPATQPLMTANPAGKVMDNIQAQTLAGDAIPPVLVKAAPAPARVSVVAAPVRLPEGAKPTAPLKQLAPHGLTSEEMLLCLGTILERMYLHIFNKCGWNHTLGGRGFTNPENVCEPVYLADIPNVEKLLVSYDTTANGQTVKAVPFNGSAQGVILVDGQLPGYHLQFNLGGMVEKRSFIPQDMQKTDNNGNLKDWSKKAQAGHMIAMMLDDGGVVVKISSTPGQAYNYEFDPFKRFV